MSQSQREKLQIELEEILGGNLPEDRVYFQPTENSKLIYPCIVYGRNPAYREHADNIVYRIMQRYEVTLIDRKPDSPAYDVFVSRLYCSASTSFVADGLHHDVFDLYH